MQLLNYYGIVYMFHKFKSENVKQKNTNITNLTLVST